MDVKTFKQLFVHRDDIYAVQRPNGGYNPEKSKITDDVIKKHLDGKLTMGLYQLLPEEDTIKWACLDIDIKKEVYTADGFKIDDWLPKLLQQANMAKGRFAQHGVPSYIEFSGFKGYHVWVFFRDPISATVIKNSMESIFMDMLPVDEALAWEIFPKQTHVSKDSLGNLVKGPGGYHHKADAFSKFIDTVELDTVEYGTVNQFVQVNAPYKQILKQCSAVQNMWNTCLEQKNAPNFAREVFGYLFLNTEGGRRFYQDQFLAKMENYDEKTTTYHLDLMDAKIREDSKEKGYKPITCAQLQDSKYENMCPRKCAAIGGAKSPIAFYHWETQKDQAEETAINPMDFVFQTGNAYFEHIPQKNKDTPATSAQLSSFVIELDEHLKIVDGINDVNKFTGTIRKDGLESEFEIKHDDYTSDEKFKAVVYEYLGPNQLLLENPMKVKRAINKYSDTKVTEILRQFGYDTDLESDDMPTVYRSPSVIVSRDGVKKNDEITVDLSNKQFAKYLDLKIITDEEFATVKKHIREDLLNLATYEVTTSALAYTMLPVLFPFTTGDRTRFSFFVRGESGKGKSYLMNAFQSFYGDFDKVASWSSTPFALGQIGFFFKDAFYLIDDFKKRMFHKTGSYDGALTLLQNFSDNTARSRMSQNLDLAETFIIKGWLASTGEDTPTGEASNLARMIPLTLRNKHRDRERGGRVQKLKHLYPGFTARYIHTIFNTNPILIEKLLEDYVNKFIGLVEGQPNDARIARNIALLATSFELVSEFLWPKKQAKEEQEKYEAFLETKVRRLVEEASGQLSSERFLATLSEMISTGRVRMQHDANTDVDDNAQHIPIIGYWGTIRGSSDRVPYILMGMAFHEVSKFLKQGSESLSHTRSAVVTELFENELSYDRKEESRKFNQSSAAVIRLKPGTI